MAMRRVIRKSVFAAVTASTTSSPSRTLIDGVNKTLNAGNPVFNNVLSSKLLFSSDRFLSSSSHHSEGDSSIYNYGKDLTELARLSNVHAIIGEGEGDEIDRCIEILSRGTKNKPVIIGEPSLGRSAVVEGLVQRIVHGDVPEPLMNKKLISLDMGSLLAGANIFDDFKDRLKSAGGYSTVATSLKKERETTYQRYCVIFYPPVEERIKELDFKDQVAICLNMISCCGVSDALARLYSVEYEHFYFFGAIFSKEEAAKIKSLPNVLVVVPDSPISLQHQQYPGWPTSNGVMDLMARTLVEREIIEGYKENTNYDIEINDDCKLKFMELKAKRTHRFIVYKIEEKQKQVIVEKLGDPAQGYEDFTACLPADECRYAVYDYEYMTEENVSKSRIFFIAWSPDTASEKIKKTYANSKYRFKMELGGIQVELRATDLIEMSIDLFKSHVN